MDFLRPMRTTALVCLALVLLARTAFAQPPAFDVSGGYSFLRDHEIDENLHGWVAAIAGYVTDWLAIVGEVGGNYTTVPFLGTDIDVSAHSFMAGPRVSSSRSDVTPFGQFLVGGLRGSASALGQSESATEFAIQPGGGVDVGLRPNAGIRVGADYRRILSDLGINEFRFYAGVVLRSGTR
jgi:hypothetical protein